VGVTVPADAFAPMDYQLTWLHASLVLWSGAQPEGPDTALPLKGSGDDGPLGATFAWNIQDADLLVAFAESETYRIVLFEAKGYTGWDTSQLVSKVSRLTDLFGEDGTRFPSVTPSLVFIGPTHPPTKGIRYASWMKNPNDHLPYHLPLPQPVEQKLELTRGKSEQRALVGETVTLACRSRRGREPSTAGLVKPSV
jgi:hypothetical protein